VNALKCILVQKVGFLKYKSGLLHGHKMKIKFILVNHNTLRIGVEVDVAFSG